MTYYNYKKKTVYTTAKGISGRFVCKIPEYLRAPERHIDILYAGWKKFNVPVPRIAEIAGIRKGRVYNILYKTTFASIAEAERIDKAMVHIILSRKSGEGNA